jgi:GNAT superfamily N-acetyltransferase
VPQLPALERDDKTMIRIRRATLADADGGIITLRQSIIDLCGADHQNDPSKLDPWLRNKTVENWANWLAREDVLLLVAMQGDRVVGVGATTLRGEILLNYVHPEARFSGVSKAMLAALEAELRHHDVAQSRLQSTITARAFYARCGYCEEAGSDWLVKSLRD